MRTANGGHVLLAAPAALALLAVVALSGCFGGGGGTSAPPLPSDLSEATQDLTTSAAAGAISGEVVTAQGDPVEGAVVTASLQGVDGTADTITGAEGVFYLGNLFPAPYHVVVSHLGYEPAETTVTVAARRIATTTVTLRAQP